MKTPLVTRTFALALAFILQPSSFILAQGPLTPPGAPAPTLKTLQQVEPRIDLQNAPAAAVDTSNASYHFIINQPGSYYLSANLGVTKANGIQINAEGVTLDMNGFQISRASGSGGNGIEIVETAHRASVRNGSLKGFAYGIRTNFSADTARACAFRDLSASGCTSYGIFAGKGAVLEACRAHDNSGSAGIYAAHGSALSNCAAVNNTGGYGIYADDGSTLSNCVASNNSTGGYGILASNGSTLHGCAAYNNAVTYGIFADAGSTLTNCSAFSNASVASTSAGIATGAGATVTNCSCNANTSTAATLTPTTGMGFSVGNESTIRNCTAYANRGDGIKVPNDCVVRDNLSVNNGSGGDGAGIHVTSADNRIEANNVTGNDRGIDVDAAGNLIIKNTASGNTTDYAIAANNRYGPIINISAAGSPAVTATGTSANVASVMGSTDPWANFLY